MKKLPKILSIVLTLVMVFTLLPITSKVKAFSSVYSQDEASKLQAFLNQNSTEAGKTNGQMINPSYQAEDPSTWTGVKWTETNPKHVYTIGNSFEWYDLHLSGTLDLSGFTQLEYLNCNTNNISSINVSGASSLEYLYCGSNEISSLTLSGASNLLEIECNNNNLTSLNMGDLVKLNRLICSDNKLSSLDLSNNHDLVQLSCPSNDLNSLNVAGDDSLVELDCSDNNLVTLVTTSPKLERLQCGYNQLETLDISANANLEVLDCSYNELNSLDVHNNPNLYYLNCSNNNLSSLDISNNGGLNRFYCDHNRISSIDLNQLYELNEFNCCYNHLTTINYNRYGAEIQLNASGNGYVGLSYYYNHSEVRDLVATAEAQPGNQFLNWSDSDEIGVSRTLRNERNYNITAVFSDKSVDPNPTEAPGPTVSPGPSVSSTPTNPPISPNPVEPTLTPTLAPSPSPALTPIPTQSPPPTPTLAPAPTSLPIPITHKVTFDLNNGARTGGGETLQTVVDGGAATAPTVERDGYTFKSWDKVFDHVTQDLTVTAIWEKKPVAEVVKYHVYYDANGGEGSVPTDDKEYLEGDTAILADDSDISKEGSQFVGWSDKPDGAVLEGTEILIDKDVTLYAVWKAVEPTPKPKADKEDVKSVPKTGDVSNAYSSIVMALFGVLAVANDVIRKRKFKQ